MAHKRKDISLREEESTWMFELFKKTGFGPAYSQYKVVDANLPQTISPSADKVLVVINPLTGEEEVLQVEYQTTYDDEMLWRMPRYFGLLAYEHRKPIKQYVFNLTKKDWKGLNTLPLVEDREYMFSIFDFYKYSSEMFLECDNPFNVLLAVLGITHNKIEVVEKITEKINLMKLSDHNLRNLVYKLEGFSLYRGINVDFNLHRNMAVIKAITDDTLIQMGEERGKKEAHFIMVQNMLADKLSLSRIRKIVPATEEEWQEILKRLNK